MKLEKTTKAKHWFSMISYLIVFAIILVGFAISIYAVIIATSKALEMNDIATICAILAVGLMSIIFIGPKFIRSCKVLSHNRKIDKTRLNTLLDKIERMSTTSGQSSIGSVGK